MTSSTETLSEASITKAVNRTINKRLLTCLSLMLPGAAVTIGFGLASQRDNPYAQIPEVQTYQWVRNSLADISRSQFSAHSYSLPDPPHQDQSLSSLVQDHNTQISQGEVKLSTSLSTTAGLLEQQLTTLQEKEPVISYNAFQHESQALALHGFWGIAGVIGGLLYLMPVFNLTHRERVRLNVIESLSPA